MHHKSSQIKTQIKIASKRNVELWIYSFADMYMILSVFFITLSVLYAAKIKVQISHPPPKKQAPSIVHKIPSGGKGPTPIESLVHIHFPSGSYQLTEKSREELKLFLPVIHSAGYRTLFIEGHVKKEELDQDQNQRSPAAYLELSQQRAVQVARWLLENGIQEDVIQTFSYGSGTSKGKGKEGVFIKIAAPEEGE